MTTTMLSAEELGIPAAWRTALMLVLAKMERGELKHYTEKNALWVTPRVTGDNNFNMSWWDTRALAGMMLDEDEDEHCGSCCCIGGWAERLGEVKFTEGRVDLVDTHPALENLFYPPNDIPRIARSFDSITVEEAAQALRNYLEGGHARWEEVL